LQQENEAVVPEIRRQMIERLEAELESIIAAADAALDADERLATAAAAAAAAPSMPEASAAADAAPGGAAAGADAPASAQQLAGTVLRAVRALCAGPEAGAAGRAAAVRLPPRGLVNGDVQVTAAAQPAVKGPRRVGDD